MKLFFRLFEDSDLVEVEVAFAGNPLLAATQGIPTDWSGPTKVQMRTLARPAYLRKREGGPFGPAVFAMAN